MKDYLRRSTRLLGGTAKRTTNRSAASLLPKSSILHPTRLVQPRRYMSTEATPPTRSTKLADSIRRFKPVQWIARTRNWRYVADRSDSLLWNFGKLFIAGIGVFGVYQIGEGRLAKILDEKAERREIIRGIETYSKQLTEMRTKTDSELNILLWQNCSRVRFLNNNKSELVETLRRIGYEIDGLASRNRELKDRLSTLEHDGNKEISDTQLENLKYELHEQARKLKAAKLLTTSLLNYTIGSYKLASDAVQKITRSQDAWKGMIYDEQLSAALNLEGLILRWFAESKDSTKEKDMYLKDAYNQFQEAADLLDDCVEKAVVLANSAFIAYRLWRQNAEEDLWQSRAKSNAKQAFMLAPGEVTVLKNYALILSETGRHEKALALLEICLSLLPKNPALLNNRAEQYLALGDPESAYKDLKAANQIKPGDDDILLHFGIACLRLGKIEEALHCLNKAQLLSDQKNRVYMHRGLARLCNGKTGFALRDFHKFFQLAVEQKTPDFEDGALEQHDWCVNQLIGNDFLEKFNSIYKRNDIKKDCHVVIKTSEVSVTVIQNDSGLSVLIEAGDLVLKSTSDEQSADLYRLYGHPEVMKTFYDGNPMSRSTVDKKYLEYWKGQWEKGNIFGAFGIYRKTEEGDMEFIGNVGVDHVGDNPGKPEIAYLLLPEYWGKGYTSRVVDIILNQYVPTAYLMGFDHSMKGVQATDVVATARTDNPASYKILDKHMTTTGEIREAYGQERIDYSVSISGLLVRFLSRQDLSIDDKLSSERQVYSRAGHFHSNPLLDEGEKREVIIEGFISGL